MFKDKILGTLYGQAIGDAMGMPTELWPVSKIKKKFKGKITDFLNGPTDNKVAINYKAGQYTDDTNQAFSILEALIENNWKSNPKIIVKHILAWANSVDAWNKNILGPSSKAALTLIKEGKNPKPVTKNALTNGCGMRISPIGTLFKPNEINQLVKMVFEVTKITHSSDAAISGACMIAGAVSAAVADFSWDNIVKFAKRVSNKGLKLGHSTWAAKNNNRLEIGLQITKKYPHNKEKFSQDIYDTVGAGDTITESIPAAVAIAYYARDVKKSAFICTNLGGDTDTIGAMATAICGAKVGASNIPRTWKNLIDTKNKQHNISKLAQTIYNFKK